MRDKIRCFAHDCQILLNQTWRVKITVSFCTKIPDNCDYLKVVVMPVNDGMLSIYRL